MAATITLKRKYYSDDGGGMSTAAKLGLGLAATAGGVLAAKNGAFGAKAMRSVNKAWGQMGSFAARNGAKGIGENMMLSGAQGMGKAQNKIVTQALQKRGGMDATTIAAKANKAENAVGNAQLNKFMKNAEPVAPTA